jgi:hypothetical protein
MRIVEGNNTKIYLFPSINYFFDHPIINILSIIEYIDRRKMCGNDVSIVSEPTPEIREKMKETL